MSGFNEEVLVIAQLETKTAFDNLDDILRVPGIDAYTGGPNDLAQSLGLTGQPDHPDSLAVSSEIVERVHAANKKSASDIYTDTSFHSFIRDGAKSFIKSNGKPFIFKSINVNVRKISEILYAKKNILKTRSVRGEI